MIYTFLSEVLAVIFIMLFQNNIIINNIWLLIVPALFIFIVSSEINCLKKPVKGSLSIIYVGFAILNLLFFEGLHTFNAYTSHFGVLVVLMLVFFKFKEYFDDPSSDIVRDPLFYFLIALFFFYIGGFLVNIAINYLIEINMNIAVQLLVIRNIVNCITYSLFSLALIIDYFNRKKLSLTSAT
ncbi:hypothetical protein [Marivirga lumbricoides]